MDNAFSISILHWQNGKQVSNEIDGDCVEQISMTDGGQLHINGNLNAEINTGGHHEIIIAGNVNGDAIIKCSGFCSVFVSGDFNGTIESTDSAKLWIGANFSGTIKTGTPSTSIRINGDYDGNVESLGELSLLDLTINGFAKNDSLTQISQLGYTVFNAAVGASDVEPGIYPVGEHRIKTESGNSFSRWSIESQDME